MGQKHNRRRTRSRPRNRTSNRPRLPSLRDELFVYSAPPTPAPLASISTAPASSQSRQANYWHSQYAAWQERAQQQRHLEEQRQRKREEDEAELEAQRIRFFGGEAGDETSLCGPMLQVVMDLFDGIDYVDP